MLQRKRDAARRGSERRENSKPASPQVVRKLREAQAEQRRRKDLATEDANGQAHGQSNLPTLGKDRIVLMVRDPYWLHACWEISRQTVSRAEAAMAEHWHTAKPILRLFEVETGNTTSAVERIVRDIEIHGGVSNWYIDVPNPPLSFRVEIGYVASNGRFFSLSRSNSVTTPKPGSADVIDENWNDVARNYEEVYAKSGGYSDTHASGELQELFEERLRRPMGSPVVTSFGVGAERLLGRDEGLGFEVDAEMIVFGSTRPEAHVTLLGEPVRLRPDGTFTVRMSLPDRRQVIPLVASSADGVEQRTIVLAVERNTKKMEPVINEANE